MTKRSLFQTVAKENLIDQATEVNATADSTEPAAQQSAVDFDAELKRLQESGQTQAPTDQPAAEDPPADTGGESSTTVKPAGEPGEVDAAPTEGDALPADKSAPADKDEDDDQNDDQDDEDAEQDPAAAAEPPAPDANLERAAEGIARLARCLQSLEEAHNTGTVSPTLAAIANAEADFVAKELNLDIPAAPAMEHLRTSTESSRFQDTTTRIKQLLADVWKRFMEWINRVVQWINDFRKSYRAKKGIYDKTAAGYALRLKYLANGGDHLRADVTVNLGPLALNERAEGVEAIIMAANTLSNVGIALGKMGQTIDIEQSIKSIIDVFQELAAGSSEHDSLDLFKPFNLFGALRVTGSSDVISASDGTLTHRSEPADVNKPGTLVVGSLPGGRTLAWTVGVGDKVFSMSDAIKATAFNNFTLGKEGDSDEVSETISMNVQTIQTILNVHYLMGKSQLAMIESMEKVGKNLTSTRSLASRLGKSLEEVNTQLTAGQIQDLARLATLLPVAYDRAVAGPLHEMVRVQSRATEAVLRVVGSGLAALDAVLKAANA